MMRGPFKGSWNGHLQSRQHRRRSHRKMLTSSTTKERGGCQYTAVFHLSNKPKATHRIIARIPQSPRPLESDENASQRSYGSMATTRRKARRLLNLFAGYAAAG